MQIFAEGRDFAGADIVGDRKNQEDFHAFLVSEGSSGLLAVLADGMGGHEAGEVASRLAVESFANNFQRHGAQSLPVKLSAALQAADHAIADYVVSNPHSAGMGCTLLAAHISPAGLYWISVGDSPLYLLRKGKLTQINEDHSMAPEITKSLKAGKLTQEEALNHPHRNALRSALMGEGHCKLVDCPATAMRLTSGDIVLLASDGVQSLTDAEINNVLAKNLNLSAEDMASLLLRAVQKKQRRHQDNTTVQLVCLSTSMGPAKSALRWVLPLVAVALILSTTAIGAWAVLNGSKFGFNLDSLFRP
jgi:serine/threonine protein phosphatase PrpC